MNEFASGVATPADPRAVPGARSGRMLSWEALAGLLIGALLALGFAAEPGVGGGIPALSWRLSCLLYAVICLHRRADRNQAGAWLKLFLPFLFAIGCDCAVLQTAGAFADLARQIFIFSFAAVVFAAASDKVARRIGLWALLGAAAAILAWSLVITLPSLSLSWTYAAARELKGKSFQSGFNANEVCFAGMVSLIAGFRDELIPRWVSLPMVALTCLCSVFLAARAPVLALIAGAASAAVIARPALWRLCAQRPWLGFIGALVLTGGFLALFIGQIDAIAHAAVARQLAGRAALWQIALGAYPSHPLFGFGAGTFQEAIHANLGKAHFSSPGEFEAIYALKAGGFHNLWLSVLVERGLVGFAGLLLSWCLLVGHALRFGSEMPALRRFVVAALLVIFFLRGQVELAGLFDDADGPISAVVAMAIGLTFPAWRPARIPRGFQAAPRMAAS